MGRATYSWRINMASEKISSLPSHTLNSADIIPVAEGGTNYGDIVGQIETAAAALVHWSSLLGNLTENQVIPFDGPTPGTADTGISRLAPDSLAIGNGTAGDFSGTLKVAVITNTTSIATPSIAINGGTAITRQSGTGSTVVMTASPTFTGTVGAAAITATGMVTAAEVNAPVVPNAIGSGTSAYTAQLTDANQLVTMSAAGASTFTIPAHATVIFLVGTTLTVSQLGAGQITLTPVANVTINTASSLTTRAQYSTVSMVLLSDNGTATVWLAMGDLT